MRTIEQMLKESKVIAVVGLSRDSTRDSYRIAQYLKEQGYRVIPINPNMPEVLGERCYPSLLDVPEKIDIVDIFRRPEYVRPIVDDAIMVGAKSVWMQLGIADDEAAEKATKAGLDVVMDECIRVLHQALKREGRL